LGALTDDGELFSKIITGGETWVGLPLGLPDKIRIHAVDPQGISTLKSQELKIHQEMATVFWDMKGILLIEHIKKGSRITEVCKEICNQKVENCHTAKAPQL
jgi:hypothetical protein